MIDKKYIDGVEIHPIGIGTWGIGGFMEPEYGDEEKAVEAIKYSVSKGQNHIDAAELYGAGHTEEVIAEALKELDRDKLFIASKVNRRMTKSNEVVRSVEKILKRLEIDQLDLLYLHSYWEEENMEEWLQGVNDAVDKGLAKRLAVSNWSVENLKWGMSKTKHKIVANQMNYNILYQVEAPQEMKDLCKKENITIVAYRPVERKLLADQCENETVLEIAKKYDKTPAQIAINWLISQENTVAIPKAVDKAHIDENLVAMDFELEQGDIEQLNNIEPGGSPDGK